jgi:hypothetical protein
VALPLDQSVNPGPGAVPPGGDSKGAQPLDLEVIPYTCIPACFVNFLLEDGAE